MARKNTSHSASQDNRTSETGTFRSFVRLHFRFGWWSLLGYLTLGAVLETMHGFKVGWYLDVGNETRRLMWTLAHAHGTLLAVVNIVFGVTVAHVNWTARSLTFASNSLMAASLLMPLGFFLGGMFIYSGDPGLGILLVPPGALLLFLAVLFTAWAVR